ncbi:saccharopine dehydrogenase C-terminal domain-containing protein [Ferruginibacter albus]|uniref:saccharopine dehydrogenase C-terminal domain-containing protein n=1 Tax=Ferruginibacter albus TaxID=2875540 RepID=UPI001CC5681B|nr:saccharopine dehydrogenase C-terminal domain-containing protein [Ferruginibacter albus]UAY50662.1 saccharopine dehydrogenase NADP-binding domain-containing protein [Ferruginibacter albus]
MPSTILLFGAGKSATVLIDHLISEADTNDWLVLIADTNKEQILAKTNNAACVQAFAIDVKDDAERGALIKRADIVISLMPPALHILIAKDCVAYNKNLLTASYVDDAIKTLSEEIKEKGLLFLYEMGLDPGIDHMSAMQLIDSIKSKGGNITSLKSHCGGLVAPESDDNPWHYKISWNPRNVVMAGKAGAVYKKDDRIIKEEYRQLFIGDRRITIDGLDFLAWYPNRDSLLYIDLYHLQEAKTFIRTTLRHHEFIYGWKKIIELGLTNEEQRYEIVTTSLSDLFKNQFKIVNDKSGIIAEQLSYLGIDDSDTFIPAGKYSAADILQFILEKKLALRTGDRDMVVMCHEIEYTLDDEIYTIQSSMIVKGENESKTAMARTVGLPLGIAAKLILTKKIQLTGLQIPVAKEIYEAVLPELREFGINFTENAGPSSTSSD